MCALALVTVDVPEGCSSLEAALSGAVGEHTSKQRVGRAQKWLCSGARVEYGKKRWCSRARKGGHNGYLDSRTEQAWESIRTALAALWETTPYRLPSSRAGKSLGVD